MSNVSVVTLIRTDTTLDHSQKAEKVCSESDVHLRDANVSCSVGASLEIARWTEVRSKIANCSITEQLDGNWSSFQLANSTPPQGVIDRAIAPSARTIPS